MVTRLPYARCIRIVVNNNNVTIFKLHTVVHMCQWKMQRLWPLSLDCIRIIQVEIVRALAVLKVMKTRITTQWKLHELIIEWMTVEELKTSDIANQHQLIQVNIKEDKTKEQTSRIEHVHLDWALLFHRIFISNFTSFSLFAICFVLFFPTLAMLCYCNYSCKLPAFVCMFSIVPWYTVYNCTVSFIVYILHIVIRTFTHFLLGISKCLFQMLLVCGISFFSSFVFLLFIQIHT